MHFGCTQCKHFDRTQCRQKGFAPILILVGVLVFMALAGGAYYFGKSQIPKPQNSIIPQTPQAVLVPSSIPDASREPNDSTETANWKTYTAKGFSFQYPPGWQVGLFEHSPDIYTLQPSNTFVPESEKNSIIISKSGHCLNTQCLTVFNLEEMIEQINAKIITEAKVGTTKAYKVSLSNNNLAYVFINGADFIQISTDKYPVQLDQILSTFKFLP